MASFSLRRLEPRAYSSAMRSWPALLCVATAAAADPIHVLSVQGGKLAPGVVASGFAGFAVPAACATASKTMVAWVIYEHGKAVDVAVTQGDVEACVAKALRDTRLETGGERIGVALAITVDKPGPKVSLLADNAHNRKLLEKILDDKLTMNVGKFSGIKGDSVSSGVGAPSGRGPGAGVGTTGQAGDSKQPKLTLAAPNVDSDGWTAGEIDRVIRARAGMFRACYQRELREHPDLAGKVVIHFRIVGDGHVENASIASSTLKSTAAEECIKRNVEILRFPARDGLANVTYPFVFSAPASN